jgi:small basic protein
MLVLALALALGVALGLLTDISVPPSVLTYLGVAVLAAIDSCLGGVRAALEETFDDKVFVFGFLTNTLLAAFIVFIGDRIGVRELYLAAVVAFGIRLFDNLGIVRRLFFARWGWE